MNRAYDLLGFNDVINKLKQYANTQQAREQLEHLAPFLAEQQVRKGLRETSQAKVLLEELGTPPIPLMEQVELYLDKAVKGELLLAEEIEQVAAFLTAVRRLKSYLERGQRLENGLAYYAENLTSLNDLYDEIERSIRNGRIDDFATNNLKDVRKRLQQLEEKIKAKADTILKANKAYLTDSFLVTRNGRLCLPVKKEYRKRITGSVVEQSSTGATLFIEPQAVAQLQADYEIAKIEEDAEERCILYTLMDQIATKEIELRENIRVTIKLDFMFAKGKLSIEMEGVEPVIHTDRYIRLKDARHPLLDRNECVPLNLEIGNGVRGITITGPNTGGKTVAIKTVALLSMMASSGLHISCQEGHIALNSQILCDIGDGQNMTDNLSTFSSHIKNVMAILEKVNEETLVILDELGSGTDPAEGMGIAIAILEQLRKSGCLFLVTTHYPEVKEYTKRHAELRNARMAFDRESLRPLYRLEMGKEGESCAIYIAKHLGFPNEMLKLAAEQAYGESADKVIAELSLAEPDGGIQRRSAPRIQKLKTAQREVLKEQRFHRGDSVSVLPEAKIGIVVEAEDQNGNVRVQVQKEKRKVNHKRLKLIAPADQLYPPDYDFSIIFESVEVRKKRHQMERKYQPDMILEADS